MAMLMKDGPEMDLGKGWALQSMDSKGSKREQVEGVVKDRFFLLNPTFLLSRTSVVHLRQLLLRSDLGLQHCSLFVKLRLKIVA
ncbi:unnamed protein product [Thelazia callipaeda]|uniref:Uncharacterized protein n=1 Tax=Thelazia callipaeda TaxID=103827 RepID=A0A0N5CUT7_THECL|nr:unnamed protein product [Thelazia callipaeda]